MKKGLLLIVIYLAFISLGLPDSLLGSAWPAMHISLNVPLSYAGIIAMIVAGGTVVSSLFSAPFINRFGVAKITTISVLMTALALLGFSYFENFIFLCLLAVPLGLGAGCVDVALNNYVALHYAARHMNWLHCFWGVGAAIGPLIMANHLGHDQSWTGGYLTVGWIQICIFAILLISLPMWINQNREKGRKALSDTKISFNGLLRTPGVKQALIIFFCYCTIEATFGLWGASFLVYSRGFEPGRAALFASLYYGGITIGRFISGLLTKTLSNKQLVYGGQGLIILGTFILFLPFNSTLLPGFLLIGLGCAPIFPSLLHNTPWNFGEKYSQNIMGMQMASAYIGITLMPWFYGKLASFLGYASLLWFMGISLTMMIYMTYDLNRIVVNRRNNSEKIRESV